MRWRSGIYYAAVCILLVLLGWGVKRLLVETRGTAQEEMPSETMFQEPSSESETGYPASPGGFERGVSKDSHTTPSLEPSKSGKKGKAKGVEQEQYSLWIPPEKRPWWAKEGKGPWINPEAPPEVKKRLAEIFASGSEERPEFTLRERYSEETIRKIGELVPGPIGVMLQELALENSNAQDPHARGRPWLDLELRLHYGDMLGGELLAAIDQYGYRIHQSPEVNQPMLGEVAVTLAHRIQAGDEPKWKPPADWKRWVKESVSERKYQEWVRRGLIPED